MSLIHNDLFTPIHLNYRQESKTSDNFWDSERKERLTKSKKKPVKEPKISSILDQEVEESLLYPSIYMV